MRRLTGVFVCLIVSLCGCLGDVDLPRGSPPDETAEPAGTTGTTGETAAGEGEQDSEDPRNPQDPGNPMNGGTETGNSTSLSIRIVGYRSSDSSGTAALVVRGAEVSSARIVLDHLCLEPFGEGLNEVRIEGPFIADLLNPAPIAALEVLNIPPGRYSRIRLTFSKLDPNNPPEGIDTTDPILDRSLLMTGWRSDRTPFEMSTAVNEEFQLRNETTGITIDPSSSIFFIAFDLDGWFEGVALDAESVESSSNDEGEIILIDDQHNQQLRRVIEENIKVSADLFEDLNRDGLLGQDEEGASLASGSSFP